MQVKTFLSFKSKPVKLTASVLIFTFTLSSSTASAQGVDLAHAVFKPAEVILPDFAGQIQIPEHLGAIQKADSAGPSLILHIQDAHGELDAQRNIEKILEHLNQNYGVQAIFVEGGLKGPISQDLLKFFRDESLNLKLADFLLREGKAGGSGLFLLKSKEKIQAFGVESPELYRENLSQFREVYQSKPEADKFLNELKLDLSTLGSRYFNLDLNKFLKEWLLVQDSKMDLISHLGTLGRSAKRHLKLDLADPLNQFEYPELVRFFKLKELEREEKRTGQRAERIEEEKQKLFQWLGENGFARYLDHLEAVLSPSLRAKSPKETERSNLRAQGLLRPAEEMAGLAMTEASDTRTFLEHFYETAHPKGFRFKDYPHLTKHLAALVLREELDAVPFFEEAEKVTEKLMTALTKTEEEKKLLRLTKDYLLLRKLFSLELTREEFDEIKVRESDFLPSEFGKSVQNLHDSSLRASRRLVKRRSGARSDGTARLARRSEARQSRSPEIASALSGTRPRNDGRGSLSLDPLFRQSLSFYETARKREEAIFENLLTTLKEKKIDRAALITGGFHEEGIASLVKDENFSYVSIAPKIRELSGSQVYLDRMLLKAPGTNPSESTVASVGVDLISLPLIESDIGRPEARDAKAFIEFGARHIAGESWRSEARGPAWTLHGIGGEGLDLAKNIGHRAESDARAEARRLQAPKEIVDGDFRGADDSLQRPAVKFPMVGDDQSRPADGVFQFNVTSALGDFQVAEPFKGFDRLAAGDKGRFRHLTKRESGLRGFWKVLFPWGQVPDRVQSLRGYFSMLLVWFFLGKRSPRETALWPQYNHPFLFLGRRLASLIISPFVSKLTLASSGSQAAFSARRSEARQEGQVEGRGSTVEGNKKPLASPSTLNLPASTFSSSRSELRSGRRIMRSEVVFIEDSKLRVLRWIDRQMEGLGIFEWGEQAALLNLKLDLDTLRLQEDGKIEITRHTTADGEVRYSFDVRSELRAVSIQGLAEETTRALKAQLAFDENIGVNLNKGVPVFYQSGQTDLTEVGRIKGTERHDTAAVGKLAQEVLDIIQTANVFYSGDRYVVSREVEGSIFVRRLLDPWKVVRLGEVIEVLRRAKTLLETGPANKDWYEDIRILDQKALEDLIRMIDGLTKVDQQGFEVLGDFYGAYVELSRLSHSLIRPFFQIPSAREAGELIRREALFLLVNLTAELPGGAVSDGALRSEAREGEFEVRDDRGSAIKATIRDGRLIDSDGHRVEPQRDHPGGRIIDGRGSSIRPDDVRLRGLGRSEARVAHQSSNSSSAFLGGMMGMFWNGLRTRRSRSPEMMADTFPARAHSSTALSFGSRQEVIGTVGRTTRADSWMRVTRSEILPSGINARSLGFEKAVTSSSRRREEITSPAFFNAMFVRIFRGVPRELMSALTNTFVSTTSSFISFLTGILDDPVNFPLADGIFPAPSVDFVKQHSPALRQSSRLEFPYNSDTLPLGKPGDQLIDQLLDLAYRHFQVRHGRDLLRILYPILSTVPAQGLSPVPARSELPRAELRGTASGVAPTARRSELRSLEYSTSKVSIKAPLSPRASDFNPDARAEARQKDNAEFRMRNTESGQQILSIPQSAIADPQSKPSRSEARGVPIEDLYTELTRALAFEEDPGYLGRDVIDLTAIVPIYYQSDQETLMKVGTLLRLKQELVDEHALAYAAVAIAAERIQRKNLEAFLREEAERLIETGRVNFDTPELKTQWIEGVVKQELERVEREVLPERFKAPLPDRIRPEEFDLLSRAVPAVSVKQVQDFERMFLQGSDEFAPIFVPVSDEISPDSLEGLLAGLRRLFENQPNKILVLASPHAVSQQLSGRFKDAFDGRAFLFGGVSDYGSFLEGLFRGEFSESESPLANEFFARARKAYEASGAEAPLKISTTLLAASEVVGHRSIFNGMHLSRVPRKFMDEEDDLQLAAADRLYARIAYGFASSGGFVSSAHETAAKIQRQVSDHLVVTPEDSSEPAVHLSFNPSQRDGILTLIEAFRAYQKLQAAA